MNPSANAFLFGDFDVHHKDWFTYSGGIDRLVNYVITFLSQVTLLKWLTFLRGSQTVILTVVLFWIYLFLLALVFIVQSLSLHLGNSNRVVVSVSIDFPSYSQWDASFHRIAYDYSGADWKGLCDHFGDVP